MVQAWLSSCTLSSFSLVQSSSTSGSTSTTPAPSSHGAGAMLGSGTPVNISDPAVIAAAECAVQQINGMSNSLYATMLVSVASGTQQIVSGMKYSLIINTGLSSCRNDGTAHTLEQCPVSGSPQQYEVFCVLILNMRERERVGERNLEYAVLL